MKTPKSSKSMILACAGPFLLGSVLSLTQAQTILDSQRPLAEKAATAEEKLADLKSRNKASFDKLAENLNRLSTETSILGSKELFRWVDESTREMKSIRMGCTNLMGSLRTEAKSIEASPSFTDGQKKELLESAEALATECKGLSDLLDHSIIRLAEAYTLFPTWNRIHKSYRNLQGDEKAAKQVKTLVDDYLGSFVPDSGQIPDDADPGISE